MAEQNNTSIWSIFKNQFNKVFKELLGFEENLNFKNKPLPISDLKQKVNISKSYLKVNISLDGITGGSMALLYDSDTATSIEYLMLMGFSDKLDTIEESTIDANQEFTQNLIDSVRSGVSASDVGVCELAVTEVSIVDDIEGIDVGQFSDFISFKWFQQNMEEKVDSTIFILLDEQSKIKMEPKKEEENNVDDTPISDTAVHSETDTGTNKQQTTNNNDSVYVVEIEDCDKRKTIFKEELDNLKLILNVELKLTVRIGTKTMLLKDIVNIDIGTTLELEQLASEPLDILINGVKIAEGEVVVVEGKFGIQIVKINSKVERLSKIKFKN